MATSRVKSSTNQKKLEDYRAYQEEMLKISREYSQSRLAVWVDEARSLHDTWSGFTQEWQANLEQMTALAGSKFEEMAARGEASAGLHGPELAEEPVGRLRGGGAVGRRLSPDLGAGGGGLGIKPWGAGGAPRKAGHRFWAGSWISAAGFTREGLWRPTRGW